MRRTLTAAGLAKRFGTREILRGVDLTITGGECVGIVGDNGSGTVSLSIGDGTIAHDELPQHVGYVAPYLRLYDEFTPVELLHFHARWHGLRADPAEVAAVLSRVGLADRMNDSIRTFSSGMQQRVTIAVAVHCTPDRLLLDEPSVTLDRRGRDVLEAEIARIRAMGSIVVLATNDDRERSLCSSLCNVSAS
jgi:ABC-type multidrug transport system ATPase subunit